MQLEEKVAKLENCEESEVRGLVTERFLLRRRRRLPDAIEIGIRSPLGVDQPIWKEGDYLLTTQSLTEA